MTTATNATCPAWCVEHGYDTDGSMLSHDKPFVTPPGKQAWITLHQDETGDAPRHFIDIQVQGGNCWTVGEVEALIASLAEAAAALRMAPAADEVARLAGTDWEHRPMGELFTEAQRLGVRVSELVGALEEQSGHIAMARSLFLAPH